MSMLAKKVPVAKKTGNAAAQVEAMSQRKSLIRILNILDAHPEYKRSCLDYLLEKMRQDSEDQKKNAETTFAEVTCFGKLDTTWMGGVLVELTPLTKATLSQLHRKNGDILKQMLCCRLNISPYMKLPPDCIEKQVTTLACKERIGEVGPRLQISSQVAKEIQSSLEFPWGKVGPYVFEWKDGKATSCLHRPSGDKVDCTSYDIKEGHDIKDGWSDFGALMVNGPQRIKLCDLFAKQKGPWSSKTLTGTNEVFNAHVRRVATQLQAAQKEVMATGVVQEDQDVWKAAATEKRKEATKRAREALKKRQADSAAKRLCKAGSSVAA